ncbi:MAG: hypothetical protein PUB71_05860 [Hallerella succinigenes]|nr:hypothetical protein [Hallerella succinigenes]
MKMNASGPVWLGHFLIGVLARKADSNASSYPSLIKTFYKMLEKAGYKAQEGSIVDTSIVGPRASVHDSNVYGKLAKGDKNEMKCAQPA